jgi:hypothetical protein
MISFVPLLHSVLKIVNKNIFTGQDFVRPFLKVPG